MKRISALIAVPLILLGALPLASAGDAKPNIVLFVSDDHGVDALGCYGNPITRGWAG